MSAAGGGVSVNYEEMQGLETNLRTASADLQSAINRAQSAVVAVANVSWTGSAATSFGTLHDQWNSSAKQIMQSLSGLADFLRQARPAYEQTDQQLAGGLGGSH